MSALCHSKSSEINASLFKAKGKSDYHQISTFVKFMMFLGVLYSLFLPYLMTINA